MIKIVGKVLGWAVGLSTIFAAGYLTSTILCIVGTEKASVVNSTGGVEEYR